MAPAQLSPAALARGRESLIEHESQTRDGGASQSQPRLVPQAARLISNPAAGLTDRGSIFKTPQIHKKDPIAWLLLLNHNPGLVRGLFIH